VTGFALSEASRSLLLRVARRAIECELGLSSPAEDTASVAELQDHRGAFVTLRRRPQGALRGCVGITQPLYSLPTAVARASVSAAFRDPRFPAVVLSELPHLSVHVSVLSPLHPLAPEDVRVGVHGLLVRRGELSGLLLPQVAASEGWDRETFLAHTCLKAGLPGEAWREPECEVQAFTAVVFGEVPE
jgi:AmmeMemoRadiSam system protein A